MKKTFLVIKTEVINTVSRPSFLIITFGLPLIAFILMNVFTNASGGTEAIGDFFTSPVQIQDIPQGYVDEGNFIKTLPSNIDPDYLVAFPDEKTGRDALESGEISNLYLIPEDVVDSGEYTVISPNFSPVSSNGEEWMMEWTLLVNMLNGDEQLASQIENPMMVNPVSLATPDEDVSEYNPLSYWIPYGITMFFYFVILGSASMMLNSIGKEKQNRVIEVLLLSTNPTQLISGKLIGLGLVGLLQTVVYIGIGYSLLKISGRSFEMAANFNLPPEIIFWGILYFILGYAMYASLMAGLGALAPNTREASQMTFYLIIPLIVPLFFIATLINDPNSTISMAISLFPLTAPVAMMTRIAATAVPWWQPVTAAVLMLITAYLIVITVSKLFRAQTLLSGSDFKPAMFFKALFAKS